MHFRHVSPQRPQVLSFAAYALVSSARVYFSIYLYTTPIYRDEVVGGTAPLVKLLGDFGGLSPSSNAKLLNIFLEFFYSAVDFQTYFNICLQCQGRANGGSTPFLVEIMAANQPNF